MKTTELDNVSYSVFLEFDADKFDYYSRFGKLMRPDPGNLEEIVKWTYGKVKQLQMKFTQDFDYNEIPGIIAFCHEEGKYDDLDDEEKKTSTQRIREKKWHEVFGLYNHIKNEVDVIVEREKILSYEPEADQVEAGIEMFQQFGVLTTIDVLADGNVLMWDAIEEKPYYLIFAKLQLESVKRVYNKNMAAIQKRKK